LRFKLKIVKDLKEVLVIFLISKFFIFSIVLISSLFIEEIPWQSSIPFVNLFARWDSGYYMEIAKLGYVNERAFAFFPLYPLILKIFSFLPFNISLWFYDF